MMTIRTLLLAAGLAIGLSPVSALADEDNEITCFLPFWVGFGPTFLADDLGYYAEEGLEVNIQFNDDRAVTMAAMERGDVDCWEGTTSTYVTRPRTAVSSGIIIGAIDVSSGADGVVADASIKTVADLKGKIYADQIATPSWTLLHYELKKAGIDPSEIELLSIDGGDAMAVFEDRTVAAVGTWEPLLSQIVNETSRDGAHILLHSGQYPGLILDVITIATAELRANPDKYAGFLRSIYRAIDFYDKDPDKAIALMAPHFDLSSAEFKESMDSGVDYTSYEETVELFGAPGVRGSIYDNFDALMAISIDVDMADTPLIAENHIDKSLLEGLWEGHKR
jgi:NitT/TauT family transport system substrate-binding protein